MKIAVVGTGIGGLSAAYHLIKDGHDVVLYEKEQDIGGHTYALTIDNEQVDIGFMMFGDSNPNIKQWFRTLGCTNENGTTSKRIPMALSVSSNVMGDVQFSSRKPFDSLWDLTNLEKWKILRDIYYFTEELKNIPIQNNMTTKEWAMTGKYSHEFFRYYFLPFTGILWTIPLDDVLNLPVTQFLRCLKTHAHSLYLPLWQVVLSSLGIKTERPRHLWWYVGSGYLQPFKNWLKKQNDKTESNAGKGQIEYNCPVKKVGPNGKYVVLEDDTKIEYDHVVLACHGETCASMIEDWYPEASKKLNEYYFHKCMMYVHRDPSLLPEDPKAWCSWNVRITQDNKYILTYWMNRIQHLKSKENLFVTIVDRDYQSDLLPKDHYIIKKFPWDHPRLLADCKPLQEFFPSRLDNSKYADGKEILENGITLTGAWLGRGFHEDGFVAGRRVAAVLRDSNQVQVPLYEDDENIPIPPVKPFNKPLWIQLLPVFCTSLFVIFLGIGMSQMMLE